jgi:hypothetical protein
MKNQTYGIVAVFLIVLASCSPRFYTPNVIVTPTFKKAGDIYFNANYNFINKGSTTFGYAFTNHFGAYTNLAINLEDHLSYSPLDVGSTDSKGGYLSLGLGYLRPPTIKNKKGLECFGEMASGLYDILQYTSVNYSPYLPDTNRLSSMVGRFNRYAIVLNLNETMNKLTLINSFRFSAVHFYRNVAEKDLEYLIEKINHRKIYPTVEYGLSMFYGKNRLKLMAQYNVFISLNSKSETGPLQAANVSLSLGFVYKLHR